LAKQRRKVKELTSEVEYYTKGWRREYCALGEETKELRKESAELEGDFKSLLDWAEEKRRAGVWDDSEVNED
jgi:hypothetical protein